jgi:mannose-6-phosphate isomerase-like protein (cupin superfamily)
MRVCTVLIGLVLFGGAMNAQAPAPTPTDRTKATLFTSAELKAALAKLPTDRPAASVRVFSLDPYNVGVEQRQPREQGASLHEAQAELFYVIEGSATMVTGGKLIGEKRNGTNLQGSGIDGGTRLAFNAGDFIMVPSGVAHQFVDIKAPVRVMSMYLPNAR